MKRSEKSLIETAENMLHDLPYQYDVENYLRGYLVLGRTFYFEFMHRDDLLYQLSYETVVIPMVSWGQIEYYITSNHKDLLDEYIDKRDSRNSEKLKEAIISLLEDNPSIKKDIVYEFILTPYQKLKKGI